ncbi:HEAT repeat domain-containing protein, partial [bacterium]|nr:HEAT repeat domain-containing protein [bacterium]
DEAISFKNDAGLKIFSNKTECSFALAKIDEFSIDERKIGRRLTSFINEKMGESAISDKSEKSMLQQQARGMSRQEMLTTFKVYGRTGKIHDKSLFLWRAVGFLKLHPEMIKDLFPLFEDSATSSEGRMLIFGLLASVESSEAQAAMLKLLGSETALNDSHYPLMYQHLTLLKKPDAAVVAKIEETYNNEKDEGDFKEEAALSLGAVAYNLRNNNQAEAADRLNEKLVSDLKSATTNKDKETMLDALGNSGDNDNFDEVSGYADASNSPQVRASALNALRRTDSKEATSLLIDMVEDSEPLVKKQAMNSLAHHELDDDSLAELEQKIINGSFSGSEYLDLLNLLSRFQKSSPQAVKNILEAFLAKGINDPHVVMRAKSLLDSVNKRLQGEI